MFKDDKEMDYYYTTTKAIFEEINYQISDLNDLGLLMTEVSIDSDLRCLQIETEYLNIDDGERHSLINQVYRYRGTYDFLPKILYVWLKEFARGFNHDVLFNANLEDD